MQNTLHSKHERRSSQPHTHHPLPSEVKFLLYHKRKDYVPKKPKTQLSRRRRLGSRMHVRRQKSNNFQGLYQPLSKRPNQKIYEKKNIKERKEDLMLFESKINYGLGDSEISLTLRYLGVLRDTARRNGRSERSHWLKNSTPSFSQLPIVIFYQGDKMRFDCDAYFAKFDEYEDEDKDEDEDDLFDDLFDEDDDSLNDFLDRLCDHAVSLTLTPFFQINFIFF